MNALEREIRSHIIKSGPLSLSVYMDLALTHPKYGYYTSHECIGRRGDFITAPEISQTFGELIGLFFADRWLSMGKPSPLNLIELGPGRGTLMKDVLRSLRVMPDLLRMLCVNFVEVSPLLVEIQKDVVPQAKHFNNLTEIIPHFSFILANEFFDALPVCHLVKKEQGWFERKVGLVNDRLTFVTDKNKYTVCPPIADAVCGDIFEFCPQAEIWLSDIARILQAKGGLALIVDYGHQHHGFGDTLQAVKAHAKVNPLVNPGEVDLTAHVNFAALKDLAYKYGLIAYGPVEQGKLLRALGIDQRQKSLIKNASSKQSEEIISGIERLISPHQMGRHFKVLALTDKTSPPPLIFRVAG